MSCWESTFVGIRTWRDVIITLHYVNFIHIMLGARVISYGKYYAKGVLGKDMWMPTHGYHCKRRQMMNEVYSPWDNVELLLRGPYQENVRENEN